MLPLAALTFAPAARSGPSITPQALAQVEAPMNFCAKVNSPDGKVEKQITMPIPDTTEQELAKMRSTKEYKETYESINKELAKVSKEKATKACVDYRPKKD